MRPRRGGRTEFWRGVEVAEYERKQRLLVMRKEEALRTAAEVLPFPRKWNGRVLDIGAGQGALASVLLRRYPRCEVTLTDASDEMLAVAEKRLRRYAKRTRFLVSDFNARQWWKPLVPPYRAVVSALALHYLDPRKRAAFFRRVYELLDGEGGFVDVDSFHGESAAIEKKLHEAQLRYTQRQLRRLEGREVPPETLVAWGKEKREKSGICTSTLGREIEHLRKAGFKHVECVWRLGRVAVVAGCNG